MLTGSWIIVDKRNNKAILEIFNGKIIEHLNIDKYEALPAYDYLCSLNRRIKLGGNTQCS